MDVSEVTGSAGVRNVLLMLQRNSMLSQRVQERLSTGKAVNSPLDNPTSFFAASSHFNRASDLLSRKDGITEGIQTIRAAENGITALSSLLLSMKGIASAALATSHQSERDVYAMTFTELQKQITSLANDSGYHGTNLLNGDL
jgi:flagellin-like hook-associated protein FlgL